MSMRILPDVARGASVTLRVDGAAVPAFEGETLATAMLAAGRGVLKYLSHHGEERSEAARLGP